MDAEVDTNLSTWIKALRRRGAILGLAALVVVLTATGALASSGGAYLLEWWTVDSGGATATTGGEYSLGGTAGQHEADPTHAVGGEYELKGGFWYARATTATLGGRVWQDTNGNGVLDPGEPGSSGVRVYLLAATGNRIAETTSDANGTYLFADLAPGTYFIEVALPTGQEFSPAGGDSMIEPTTGRTPAIVLAAGQQSLQWQVGLVTIPTADEPVDEPWWQDAIRTFLPTIGR